MSINYYVVPMTPKDRYGIRRPELPQPITWKGKPDGTTYLIASRETADTLTPLTQEQLTAECQSRGLDLEAVLNWL